MPERDDDGLAVLAPEEIEVRDQDRVIAVGPMGLEQMARLVARHRPVVEAVMRGEFGIDLLADEESLIDAVALASGLDAEDVRGLSSEAQWDLVFAVVEVNSDFFSRIRQGALGRLALRLARRTGPTSLNGSSSTATDGAT